MSTNTATKTKPTSSSSTRSPSKSTTTGPTKRTLSASGTRKTKSTAEVAAVPSVKELQAKITTIEDDLKKEREQRNLFQLERDKINSFWEISKTDLETLKCELRNKDREMEELEEKHQVEIKVYKQKVKHLHYEHQNNLTDLKLDGENALKNQNDEHKNKEMNLKKSNKKTKSDMRELEISHEDVAKNLKQEHDKSITKLRQEFERTTNELHQKYEKKMKQLRNELELRRKNEIHEIEERKNAHINELIKKHDAAFAEIKVYYNDITANNIELIKSLKDQLEDMKKKEASDQKLMLEVTLDNKRLTEPLQKATKEVEHLKHELTNYNKDKESLQSCKARIKVLESDGRGLKWEHEVLEQRFAKIQKERDDLYDKFVKSIHEIQQQSGLKNLLLEKKLEVIGDQLEHKDVQLNEVISSANLDPHTVNNMSQKVGSVIEDKNATIKQLKYELTRVKKANNDIVRVYESKLKEFGVPIEELGFEVDDMK